MNHIAEFIKIVLPTLLKQHTKVLVKIILPTLLKQHSKLVVQIFIFSFFLVANNYSTIEKYLTKEDITTRFIDKAFKVESELEIIRKEYDADGISVSMIHNGTTAAADVNFHLMKYSVMFSVGEDARQAKIMYRSRPLSLWINEFRNMYQNGYYLIEDISKSKDPLVRRIGDQTHVKTIVYLPLYSKEQYLLGFAVITYKEIKDIPKETIVSMQRSLLQVESLL